MSGSWAKPGDYLKGHLLAAAAVGAGTFIVYLMTLSPTLATNDAGRFQITASVLGTGHPTGYPTFILLGKLFTYLPLGDVAYRLNLMAATFGALGAALLFLVAREVGSRALPAAGAALVLAFSSTFWSQATIAEVYTMHAAFLLGVAFLLLRWRRTRRGLYVLLAAVLYGVSLGNNAGMVLLAPAFLIPLFAGRHRCLSPGLLAGSGGLFFLGLSVYAYVPIRGFAGAWHNYGDPVNDWTDVWALISGARFQGLMDVSPPELLDSSGQFLRALFGQATLPFGYGVGLLLLGGGVYGAWALVRRDGAVGGAFAVGLVCTLVYAVGYRIDDIAVYYIPVYLFLTLFTAVGASRLAECRGGMLWAVLPLAVAGLALYANYEEQDRSGYYAERERSEAVLERLPEDAVLYGKVQIIPITYLTVVEERREDVTLRWLDGKTQRDHMESDIESGRPVYVISDPRYNEEYLGATESYARAHREDGLIRLRPR
ncbi:MAG: DUF2723 domain-containing protein [Actinomycetota bacterium]|nr:DUF2723 domain-containing protein [Actinomycetota bacterium]